MHDDDWFDFAGDAAIMDAWPLALLFLLIGIGVVVYHAKMPLPKTCTEAVQRCRDEDSDRICATIPNLCKEQK